MALPAYQLVPYGFQALQAVTHLLWVQSPAASPLLNGLASLGQQHARHAQPRGYGAAWEAAAEGAATLLSAAHAAGDLRAIPWVIDTAYTCDDTWTEPWGEAPALLLQRLHRFAALDPRGLENQAFYEAAPADAPAWQVWLACPQWLAVLPARPSVEAVWQAAQGVLPAGMRVRLTWRTRALPQFYPFPEGWLHALAQPA